MKAGRRDLTLLIVLAVASLPGYALIALLGDLRAQIVPFEAAFFALFGLYLVACWIALRGRLPDWAGMGVILLFALGFRLILVPSTPSLSDDVYRYVWDGRVFAHGISPYEYPPRAEELADLRDQEIHPRINRTWARSVYPPLTEVVFLGVHRLVGDSVQGMKTAMVLVDVLNVYLLMVLLARVGLAPSRALIYGWSPLAGIEVGGSGHFEPLMIAFLLLAVLAWLSGRRLLAGVLLGAGALVKLFPGLLLPVFFRRDRPWTAAAFGAVLVLAYLPFVVASGAGMLEFFGTYFGEEEFNSGVTFGLLRLGSILLPGSPGVLRLAPALVFLGVLAALLLRPADGPFAVLNRLYVVVAAYLLLAPNVHPWYLLWLLPLLAVHLRPGHRWLAASSHLGWLLFSGLCVLSYLFYPSRRSFDWVIGLVEYAPLYAILLWAWRPTPPLFHLYRRLATRAS